MNNLKKKLYSVPMDILTDMCNEEIGCLKNEKPKKIYLSSTSSIRNDAFNKIVDEIHRENDKGNLFQNTFEIKENSTIKLGLEKI